MLDTKNATSDADLSDVLKRGFDSLPIGVMIMNAADLTILGINDTYRQFFDAPGHSGDLVGRYIGDVGASGETIATIRAVIASGKAVTMAEYCYEGFARGRTYWRWVTTPLLDSDKVSQVVITAEEITRQVLDRESMKATIAQEKRLRDENRLLYEISRKLSSTDQLDGVLQEVAEQLAQLIGAEWVTVLLWDEQVQGLRISAATRLVDGYDPGYIVPVGSGVSGRAFATGEKVDSLDYRETDAPSTLKGLAEQEHIRASFAIPIINALQKLGVITVSRTDSVPFNQEVQSLVTLLAEQIGVALTKNYLYQESREKELRLRELLAIDERITSTLLEVAATVAGAVSQEEIMQRVVGMLPGFIGCDRASITLYDAETNIATTGPISGVTSEQEEYIRQLPVTPIDLENPLTKQLLIEHKPLVINDPAVFGETPLNVKSAMYVPMVARGRVLGFVGLDQSGTAHYFSHAEQLLMQGIANMIALSLENAALLEANARNAGLVEANRLKDEFLGIASHELKTPMTTIQGYVQVLKRRVGNASLDRDALVQVVDTINDQTRRMNRLVDELLDISRIEAGRLEMRREPVDIEAMLEELVEQQQMTSEQVTISLAVAPDAAHLTAYGDESRLQQVALNLLSNALKYSPAGSKVTVSLCRTDGFAEVNVKDTGVGISADEQEHLFERFFRTEGARVSGVGGLGLGLYIASTIVREHGGRMWVRSQPGEGSAFFFTVPLAKNKD